MNKRILYLISMLLIAIAVLADNLPPQRELQTQSDEESSYGANFFDQLRAIFGKFREMDLQRVFQEAQPIQCSELVGRKGEWRPVAFFNEDRRLGDWYRESLTEVKSDLTVYTFKGDCGGGDGTVQVTTEYPTSESIEAYNQGRINLDQMDVTVNDPVAVSMKSSNNAYTFELPYLFLTDQKGSMQIYSFMAPNRNSTYAPNVSSRWECKAVSSKDVTYRFLICRTATVPRSSSRNRKWEPAFGSSAFFILSDGMEAQTSVKVLYGDGTDSGEKQTEPGPNAPGRPVLKRNKTASPAAR